MNRLVRLGSRSLQTRAGKYLAKITPVQIEGGNWGLNSGSKLLKVPGQPGISAAAPSLIHCDLLKAEFEGHLGELKDSPTILSSLIFRGSILGEQSSASLKIQITADVLRYLDTDTICYFETDDRIHLKQLQVWAPIIEALNRRFNFSIKTTQSISRINQDEEIRAAISETLASSSPHSLAAFEYLTRNLKSALLTLALKHNLINGLEAVNASLLEQEAQSAQWGIIPESHALQRCQLERHVALALTFL